MSSTASSIIELGVGALRPRPTNARTHSKKQVRKIAESVRRFGFVNPVLIDEERHIVAGHGRVEAAKLLGLQSVPTITVSHLTPAELRAYVIADNKLATLAGWDRDLLAIEVASLSDAAPELDLTVTGFDLDEIEILKDLSSVDIQPCQEEVATPSTGSAVTRTGDVWIIGKHRLMCGDALDRSSYRSLLGGERADLVITDPPYNVPIGGHVSGLGKVRHPEFQMASGEMSRSQFQRFLSDVCANLARFSRSGSLHFIFMDWRSIGDLLNAGEQSYDGLINIIAWVKTNAGMGALYRSRHELVAVFKRGKRPHINNVELGVNGRYRTNVWEYAGANSFSPTRADDLVLHPTVKNCEMIVDAIKDVTDPGNLVLDPFGGSGTTLIAAEKCRRRACLIELDPSYCDTIVSRSRAAGLDAYLESSGETFAEVTSQRAEHAPASSV